MVEVKEGMVIDCAGAKYGDSAKGPWWMVRVGGGTEGKGQGITVFAENADDAQAIKGKAKIGHIIAVRRKAWKLANGSWANSPSVEVTAYVERLSEAEMYSLGGYNDAPSEAFRPGDNFSNMPLN